MATNYAVSGTTYHAIAVDVSNALTALLGISSDILAAVNTIVDLTTVSTPDGTYATVDLANSFWDSYNVSAVGNTIPSYLLSMASVLNQHVIDRGICFTTTGDSTAGSPYANINDYLADPGKTGGAIKVPANFATVSDAAGWTIDHANIG